MSIDHHPRMSVCRTVVILDPIFAGTRNNLSGVELEGSHSVFVSVGLGYGAHPEIPYLHTRISSGSPCIRNDEETGAYSDGLV